MTMNTYYCYSSSSILGPSQTWLGSSYWYRMAMQKKKNLKNHARQHHHHTRFLLLHKAATLRQRQHPYHQLHCNLFAKMMNQIGMTICRTCLCPFRGPESHNGRNELLVFLLLCHHDHLLFRQLCYHMVRLVRTILTQKWWIHNLGSFGKRNQEIKAGLYANT